MVRSLRPTPLRAWGLHTRLRQHRRKRKSRRRQGRNTTPRAPPVPHQRKPLLCPTQTARNHLQGLPLLRNRHTRRTALLLPAKYRNHHSRQTLAANNLLALRKYTLPYPAGVHVGKNTAQIFARLSAPYPKRCTLRSGNQRPRRVHLGLRALVPTITMRPRRRRNSILVRKTGHSKMHHPTLLQRTRNIRLRSVVRGRYVQRKNPTSPSSRSRPAHEHAATCLPTCAPVSGEKRKQTLSSIERYPVRKRGLRVRGRNPSRPNRTLRTGRTLLRRRRALEQNLPARRRGKNKPDDEGKTSLKWALYTRPDEGVSSSVKALKRWLSDESSATFWSFRGLATGASFTGLHPQHEIRMRTLLRPPPPCQSLRLPLRPEAYAPPHASPRPDGM